MIVMVFAQLERETIQQRVMDAYRSRSRKGFYMGGRVPYGFELENTVMEGIKTCMYKPIPEQIQVVQLIFSLYAMPQVSFADVVRYLSQNGIKNPNGKNFSRMRIRDIITNPVYAKADASIYEFFHGQGTEIINDISQFIGTNGAYLYTGNKAAKRKSISLDGHVLVLAPHAGCIDADTWIRCRRKCLNVRQIAKPVKAKNTWLAGKVKCGRCGYALMSVGNPTGVQYLRCSKRADSKSCDGCGTLRTREFERFLYGEMVKKLSEFQTLTAKRETVNPKLTALNMELARVEDEIEKLLNTLTGANAVLLSYANSKIEELDTRRQALTKEIAALSAETMSPEQIERLSVYLNQWEEIDFEDRRQVADGLISQIRATDEHVSIEWKI